MNIISPSTKNVALISKATKSAESTTIGEDLPGYGNDV
jgi:hypothetical protein